MKTLLLLLVEEVREVKHTNNNLKQEVSELRLHRKKANKCIKQMRETIEASQRLMRSMQEHIGISGKRMHDMQNTIQGTASGQSYALLSGPLNRSRPAQQSTKKSSTPPRPMPRTQNVSCAHPSLVEVMPFLRDFDHSQLLVSDIRYEVAHSGFKES